MPIKFVTAMVITIAVGLFTSCHSSSSRTEKPSQNTKQTEYELRKGKMKAALSQIGDIELDPRRLTLAKLNQIFQAEGKAAKTQRFTNTTTLEWFDDSVSVTFKSKEQVKGTEKPFEIEIWNFAALERPYFLGSIYGIHLNDSPDNALKILRKRGCKPNISDKYAECKGAATIRWHDYNGKIDRVSISVGSYWVFPG